MILQQPADDKWKRAYDSLEKLLAGKDYFIVSLCMDDYIYSTNLEKEKIVTPCGGFRKMQCDCNCSHSLWDVPGDSFDAVKRYYRKEIPLDALQEPLCPVCGAKLRFNQLGVTSYAEEGYLEQWQGYTRWLQSTVNRRLCVLELGVGGKGKGPLPQGRRSCRGPGFGRRGARAGGRHPPGTAPGRTAGAPSPAPRRASPGRRKKGWLVPEAPPGAGRGRGRRKERPRPPSGRPASAEAPLVFFPSPSKNSPSPGAALPALSICGEGQSYVHPPLGRNSKKFCRGTL